MSPFREKVLQIVSMVPKGSVVSYGQVALMAGIPRGARQVGWALNQMESSPADTIPWWRVINNAGRISIKSPRHPPILQKEKLEEDGLPVGNDFSVDIEKYRWRPNQDILEKLKLKDEYIFKLLEKF